MALCESLVRIVERETAAKGYRSVRRVYLKIGALSCVSAESMAFCFQVVRRGTCADGADLEIERVPGQAWCATCEETVTIAERYDPCPRCHGYGLKVLSGDDLEVTSLDVE